MELWKSVDGMWRSAHSMLMKLYISVPLLPTDATSQLSAYLCEQDSQKTINCLKMCNRSSETTWVNWEGAGVNTIKYNISIEIERV